MSAEVGLRKLCKNSSAHTGTERDLAHALRGLARADLIPDALVKAPLFFAKVSFMTCRRLSRTKPLE
jgi:hypothetical protein